MDISFFLESGHCGRLSGHLRVGAAGVMASSGQARPASALRATGGCDGTARRCHYLWVGDDVEAAAGGGVIKAESQEGFLLVLLAWLANPTRLRSCL